MRARKQSVLGLTVAAIVAVLFAACGGGEKATPTPAPTAAPQPTATSRPQPTATPVPAGPTGKLTVAVAISGFESLDPVNEQIPETQTYQGSIYDYLLWADKDGNVAPGVAERWEMSPDGKTWTFSLRQMQFHNSQPVTAADFKFSVERAIPATARSTYAAQWRSSLDTVEAVNERTVKITAKAPWPDLKFFASLRGSSDGAFLPKAVVEQQGEATFFQKPVGSGPWKFVRHDRGVAFHFEANTARHPFRPTPAFKDLEIRLVPEESTRIATLRTGTADMVGMTFESVSLVRGSNLQVFQIPRITNLIMAISGAAHPRWSEHPTSKLEVRQALALAVNRQEIIDTIMGGLAELPARPYVIPGIEGYDASWQPERPDPARARQLIQQAGYPRGFEIEILSATHATAPYIPRIWEAVAAYWQSVGVNPKITTMDYGTLAGFYRVRPNQDRLMGTTFIPPVVVPPTPLINFFALAEGRGVVQLQPQADALIDSLRKAVDPAERQRLIREIVQAFHDFKTQVGLATAPAIIGAGNTIAGWTPIPSAGIGMSLETVRKK
ncbi:MAG: ABC transporter substrate-binding protein [Chloroflexi bacterium]|nr:ABC transporter substrate-binding protein [Chloroflexota bacterium]